MPFSSREHYNQYRREWRAQQRGAAQGVPPGTRSGRFLAAVSRSGSSLAGTPAGALAIAAHPQPVHPPELHSSVCWACSGTGFSSAGSRCSYCSFPNVRLFPSFKAAPATQAGALPDVDTGSLALGVGLVLGGSLLALWLLKKLFWSTCAVASPVSLAEPVYEAWGPALAAKIREALPGGGL